MNIFKRKPKETAESGQQTAAVEESPRLRVRLLDTLRGIAIFYMLFYHTIYDLAFIFGLDWAKQLLASQHWAPLPFGIAFVFLGGVTIKFSRNPASHGAKLLLIAGAFTIVTSLLFPGQAIYFGVLHLFAVAMLVFSVVRKPLGKLPIWLTAPIFLALFALTLGLSDGYFGIKGLFELPLPATLLANNNLYPFGIVGNGFHSADYYPVLPWLFMFLAGTSFGKLFVDEDGDQKVLPKWVCHRYLPLTSLVGRYSLAIYVLHQPVIYLVLVVLDYFSVI